jgi:hypothetical protein
MSRSSHLHTAGCCCAAALTPCPIINLISARSSAHGRGCTLPRCPLCASAPRRCGGAAQTRWTWGVEPSSTQKFGLENRLSNQGQTCCAQKEDTVCGAMQCNARARAGCKGGGRGRALKVRVRQPSSKPHGEFTTCDEGKQQMILASNNRPIPFVQYSMRHPAAPSVHTPSIGSLAPLA